MSQVLLTGLLIALGLILPLGQLEQLPLGLGWGRIYFHDLILAALWGVILTQYRSSWWALIKKDRLSQAFLAFSLWAGIAWILNYPRFGPQSLVGLAYLVRWFLFAAPYFALKVKAQSATRQKLTHLGGQELKATTQNLKVLSLIRFSLFLTALLGLVQYWLFPDLRYLRYFGWDDHYYRLTGTFLDPNFMGLILVLALGLELINNSFLSFSTLFYSFLLYLTLSRASWLAFLILLIGWGIKKKTWKLGLLLVISYLSLVIFFPKPFGEGGNLWRTASIRGRLRNWSRSSEIIKSNWLLGVGFNNYRLAQKEAGFLDSNWRQDHAAAGVDNSFLFVWATTGLIGLGLWLWLLSFWRPRWLFLPLMVHGWFNNSLFYPWWLILVWPLLGQAIIDN